MLVFMDNKTSTSFRRSPSVLRGRTSAHILPISTKKEDSKRRDQVIEPVTALEETCKPISTEKQQLEKIVVERKFYYPAGYRGKSRRSISTKTHHTTVKKEKGKRRLLELLSMGMSLPSAIAVLCLTMGYKSRSTVYKWIEEDKEFAEEVHAEFENRFCQPGYWDVGTRSDWNDLLKAGRVVFDDLGTEDPTNLRFKTKFNHLFETRHREQRTLIILTNVRIEEYGERIVSRVRDWAVDGAVWEIQGEDLRRVGRDPSSSGRQRA